MKELKFLCIQPDDNYYLWQVHAWLESLKNIGQSNKAIILLYVPFNRLQNPKWSELIKLYPEAEFIFYKDENNEITFRVPIYIPVLRPWCAAKYFKEHPEREKDAIFYCDNDVIFTKMPDVAKYLDDDVIYLSNTNSYINASYFDSKVRNVLPEKLEEYKKQDILAQMCMLTGISRKKAEQNNLHSGGAQYLLKNIDYKFWEKCVQDCLNIRVFLIGVNQEFFKDESSGFQSWCSDMWAVLHNLWGKNYSVKVIPELDFAWATDSVAKLEKVSILHNAGIINDDAHSFPVFYKGKYHNGKRSPFDDLDYLHKIVEHPQSKQKCTSYYAQELINLFNKYKNK